MFELAQTGSVFLDEIGELPPRMQVKLLRVLDNAPYYRLGGTRKISVDARVIAATNQDLEQSMAAGEFRRDLYHRLAQVCITRPPLRDRQDDIAPLAQFFLQQQSQPFRFSLEALDALARNHWPVNVRGLLQRLGQVAAMADGDVIEPEHLPFLVPQCAGPCEAGHTRRHGARDDPARAHRHERPAAARGGFGHLAAHAGAGS